MSEYCDKLVWRHDAFAASVSVSSAATNPSGINHVVCRTLKRSACKSIATSLASLLPSDPHLLRKRVYSFWLAIIRFVLFRRYYAPLGKIYLDKEYSVKRDEFWHIFANRRSRINVI